LQIQVPFNIGFPSHRDIDRAVHEPMKLIIPRITDSTKPKDLRAFANQVLEKIFRLPFSATPRIVSCRVVLATDRMGVTQRHGLITVTPDDAAMRIIRKLNGTSLDGKRVGVKRCDPRTDDAQRTARGGFPRS
jgi:hypothetical protein